MEDYNGARSAKGIVDAVIDKIPNHVKRVDDKSLEAWLAESNETAKAILFTDKGKTSALLKSIAIDFKGSINVAQVRNTDKEKASLELFGITKFPTLLLLPGGKEAEGIVYEGELKKEPIIAFLSQAAAPNPDPAPAKVKLPKSKGSKKASKAKESFESASKSHASEEGTAAAATATEETLEEEATESPSPEVETEKPIVLPQPAPPIDILYTQEQLTAECMGSKTGTCILAILPASPNEIAAKAVGSLSEIAHRYKLQKRKIFPFYVVPESNNAYSSIRAGLSLSDEQTTEIVSVNGRRGWWRLLPRTERQLEHHDVSEEAIEDWVNSIILDEGVKHRLPEGLIVHEPKEPAAESVVEDPVSAEQGEEPVLQTETDTKTQTRTVVVEEITEETVVSEPHDEL